MSTKEVKKALEMVSDKISVRNGVYTIKKSYYWGVSEDGSALAKKVESKLDKAVVLDYGNHWHPFVGGAKSGSSKDSYLYCKFYIKSKGYLNK
jgi:hypothetical protein